MKFTVLGSTGVIGRPLTESLLRAGHSVLTPSRCALTNPNEDWGHVIYAIGLTADFRRKPFETVEAHVGLLSKFLQNARFDSWLYLSSTRVYMGAEGASETTPLRVLPSDPSDIYNISKLLGESLCLALDRPSVRVVRLSNVVGGDDQMSDNFVSSLMREARAGRILLRSALDSVKDYIAIKDVIQLLPIIATQGQHRLYNVASGQQISHRKWIHRLQANYECHVDVQPSAPKQSFFPVDVTRIVSEFRYIPTSPFEAVGL